MAVCTFATLADSAEWAECEWRVLATLPFLYFLETRILGKGLPCQGIRERPSFWPKTRDLGRRDAQRIQSSRRSLGFQVCRSEEHTSELQSQSNLVCRLLLEKKENT